MTAAETRVREQILHAAAQLAGEGLIERTWGNISARVSDTQFLITPAVWPMRPCTRSSWYW